MYKVRHARSNIFVFFEEHDKFPEKWNIIYRIWVTYAELKSTKTIYNT